MQNIVQKLASRKLWAALLVVLLAAVSAWQGVVPWTAALGLIKGAALFYIGTEASLDLAGIVKSLAEAWWTQRRQTPGRDEPAEVIACSSAAVTQRLSAELARALGGK